MHLYENRNAKKLFLLTSGVWGDFSKRLIHVWQKSAVNIIAIHFIVRILQPVDQNSPWNVKIRKSVKLLLLMYPLFPLNFHSLSPDIFFASRQTPKNKEARLCIKRMCVHRKVICRLWKGEKRKSRIFPERSHYILLSSLS